MKQINKDNKIFSTEEYIKDKNAFHIISLNLSSADLLLYSDEKSYIICRGALDKPIWVWTSDNIDKKTMNEIVDILIEKYLLTEKSSLTTKKKFYEYLKEIEFPYLCSDYFEMGALECHHVTPPRECDGYAIKATMNDLNVIAKYWYYNCLEMNPELNMTLYQASEDAKEMINSGNLYVWKNDEHNIVCMVQYKIVNTQARLLHVYTPKNKRCKGYAANLIYEITEKLLNMNLTPVLYTDYNYPASNKAYQNVGYVNTRVLINFSCFGNKK